MLESMAGASWQRRARRTNTYAMPTGSRTRARRGPRYLHISASVNVCFFVAAVITTTFFTTLIHFSEYCLILYEYTTTAVVYALGDLQQWEHVDDFFRVLTFPGFACRPSFDYGIDTHIIVYSLGPYVRTGSSFVSKMTGQ